MRTGMDFATALRIPIARRGAIVAVVGPRARQGVPPSVRSMIVAGLACSLFFAYAHLAATQPINSDGAGVALQAQDLLRGNLRLAGWTLSNISQYFSDVLPFALAVRLLGLSPAAVHYAQAALFTSVVVLAGLLARGRRGAGGGAWGAAMTVTLVMAPQLGVGIRLLLASSHVGMTMLVLTALLAIDRWGHRALGAAVAMLALAAATASDTLAVVVGVLPVVVAILLGVVRADDSRRRRLLVLPAALAAGGFGLALPEVIRAMGGFQLYPLAVGLARPHDLPRHAMLALSGLLALFGALPGRGPLVVTQTVVHLAGALFAGGVAVAAGLARAAGRDRDLISDMLMLGIVLDLVGFIFSPFPIDIFSGRYLTPTFVFAAVLAGRQGPRLLRRWPLLVPPLAGLGAGYGALFLLSLAAPPAPQVSPAARWLAVHRFDNGLGSYWQANAITVETDGQAAVRPVALANGGTATLLWESKATWYGTGNGSRFLVFDLSDPSSRLDEATVARMFGQPARRTRFGSIEVAVWNRSLPVRAA